MRALAPPALVALALAPGCGGGVSADPGADALLRVEGASFARGAPPEAGEGPAVEAAFLTQTTFRAGFQGKSFSGQLAPGATAVAIALEGDRGYWLLPAGPAEPEAPDSPSFAVSLSFSADVAPGPNALVTWAVDAAGRFGPPSRSALTIANAPAPEGALVVSLYWDADSDLDLHVVTPEGVEIYKGNVNSWQRPAGSPPDPDAWRAGGVLDADSNAQCRIDGRRAEHVVWRAEPPRGRYVVRVDAFSLCAEPLARWGVEARFGGERVAGASGTSTPAATRFEHGRGAGVLALEFDLP
ncbi:MAG TPA: hypothetical protein VFS43_09570 [Polyangiaceae bacterium]|nr:hypothetical protein [Polyangiaceae bacterium]